MVGDALVCFRAGTTDLLQGGVSYPKNVEFIFGIPNARMSSYTPVFSISIWRRALTTALLAYQMP
jgi:hypothetical protein